MKQLRFIAVLLLPVIFLWGCGDKEGGDDGPEEKGETKIKIVSEENGINIDNFKYTETYAVRQHKSQLMINVLNYKPESGDTYKTDMAEGEMKISIGLVDFDFEAPIEEGKTYPYEPFAEGVTISFMLYTPDGSISINGSDKEDSGFFTVTHLSDEAIHGKFRLEDNETLIEGTVAAEFTKKY